jgi:hypothetical protein
MFKSLIPPLLKRRETIILRGSIDNLKSVGPLPTFEETLVMFDHFWDFDRMAKDGAPRHS